MSAAPRPAFPARRSRCWDRAYPRRGKAPPDRSSARPRFPPRLAADCWPPLQVRNISGRGVGTPLQRSGLRHRDINRPAPSLSVQIDSIDLCRTEVTDSQRLPILRPAQPGAEAYGPGRFEIRARDQFLTSGRYFHPDSLYRPICAPLAVDVLSVAGPFVIPHVLASERAPFAFHGIIHVALPRIHLHSEDLLLVWCPARGEQPFGTCYRLDFSGLEMKNL